VRTKQDKGEVYKQIQDIPYRKSNALGRMPYIIDFPYPVGSDTNVSVPDINEKTASNCFSFKGSNCISFKARIMALSIATLSHIESASTRAQLYTRARHKVVHHYPQYVYDDEG